MKKCYPEVVGARIRVECYFSNATAEPLELFVVGGEFSSIQLIAVGKLSNLENSTIKERYFGSPQLDLIILSMVYEVFQTVNTTSKINGCQCFMLAQLNDSYFIATLSQLQVCNLPKKADTCLLPRSISFSTEKLYHRIDQLGGLCCIYIA